MKCFFYIFVLISALLAPFRENRAQDLSESASLRSSESSVADTPFTDFQQSVYQKFQQAKKLNPNEFSVIDYPQNMSVYTLLTLMEQDAGLLTGSKGLGSKQEFDFGYAQLVSCVGNLNHQSRLITAFLVRLKPDYTLQRPAIPATQSPLWKSEQIFYPLRPEDNGKPATTYQGIVLFPMIYSLTDSNQPFRLEKEIPLTVCRNHLCTTQTRTYKLDINPGEGYQTDVCPAIMHHYYATPKPLPDSFQYKLHQNEEGALQLILKFPKPVSDFLLQPIAPADLKIRKQYINQTTADIILDSPTPLSSNETVHFYLLSELGIYSIEAQPDNLPFEAELSAPKWGDWILCGIWFFLFSPFYLLFWSLRPQKQTELTQTFAFVSFNLILFTGIACALLFYGVQVQSFFAHPLILTIQCVLLLYLLIKPFISLRGLTLLMLLMPYPFLYTVSARFPHGEFLSAFLLSLWWAFCAFTPFWLTYRHITLFQSFGSALQPVRKIIRLPLVLMTCYTLVATMLAFFPMHNSFSEQEFKTALAENKSVFITLDNPPCPSCALNRLTTHLLYPTNTLIQQGNLIMMNLNQQSSQAKDFLKKLNINTAESFFLLYGPNKPYGLQLNAHYIQPEEWLNLLETVGAISPEPAIQITDTPTDDVTVNPEKIKELLLELKKEQRKENPPQIKEKNL